MHEEFGRDGCLDVKANVTQPSVVAQIDRLLDQYSCQAVANNLNSRGFREIVSRRGEER